MSKTADDPSSMKGDKPVDAFGIVGTEAVSLSSANDSNGTGHITEDGADDDSNWWERETELYNADTQHRSPLQFPDHSAIVFSDQNDEDEDDDEDYSLEEDEDTRTNAAWGDEPDAEQDGPTMLVPDTDPILIDSIEIEVRTIDQLRNRLNGMSEQIMDLSRLSFITRTVRQQMGVVRESISTLCKLLEATELQESRDVVESMLHLKSLPWDFENETVHAYRARALTFPHEQFRMKDTHIPRYFSGGPLPKNTESEIRCNVTLPVTACQQVQVVITSHDTAVTVIGKVYDVFEPREQAQRQLGDPSQYVLKVVGYDEFMYYSEIMYDYEAVRRVLRNNSTLELALIERPQPFPHDERVPKNTEIYKSKIVENIPVLHPEDYLEWDRTDDPLSREFIPLRMLRRPLRVRVRGVENVSRASLPLLDASISHLRVEVFLFHGNAMIKAWEGCTRDALRSQSLRWNQWLGGKNGPSSVLIGDLPRETRVCFLLCGKKPQKEDDVLAWVNIPLVDEFGQLRSGRLHLKMWPATYTTRLPQFDALSYAVRGASRENLSISASDSSISKAILSVEFDCFALPVAVPIVENYEEPNERSVGGLLSLKKLPKNMRARLDMLIKVDPLYQLTDEDKQILWATRHHLQPYPLALPKFLQSVDWTSVAHKNEAHRLLSNWTPPLNPVSALELLDPQYADYKIREYAVNCLRVLPDDELQLFLLQLTQSIKHEIYHDSPLTRFLMERALRNPFLIGHSLFWHLVAELHEPEHCERYALLLEEYLYNGDRHVFELQKQYELVQKLTRISAMVVSRVRAKLKTEEEIKEEYRNSLKKLNEMFLSRIGSLQLPLNPKWLVTTLRVEKCRYMSSKMAPLWLVFRNADPTGPDIVVMFKSGDDLRQDILTLQLLRVMDKIWVSESLDMRLTPYTCVATGVNSQGKGVGMIEVVRQSDTTSAIQLKYGGGALGALKMEPLQLFISDHNKTPGQHARAQDNFMRSCAGYCVATYVLGIGDRHNGNIMLTEDGHLFHIDFGHFLGNFKSKFGIKRERAAFVLTPEMAFVIGGKKYRKSKLFKLFTDLSAKAFTILRNHASLFTILFSLMVPAQMPELMKHEDIFYLRDKFFLDLTEKTAVSRLRKEIDKSLSTTMRTIDNFFHNLKHG